MIDYDLTDLLIELEEIQTNRCTYVARGQQAADLLEFYKIPSHLYSLSQEPDHERPADQRRRKVARFNFAAVTPDVQKAFIECLFMIGHSTEFIAEALGEDLRYVAEVLHSLVETTRSEHAAELRKNPQRFRLVTS